MTPTEQTEALRLAETLRDWVEPDTNNEPPICVRCEGEYRLDIERTEITPLCDWCAHLASTDLASALIAVAGERDEAVAARAMGLEALETWRKTAQVWLATKQNLEAERDAMRVLCETAAKLLDKAEKCHDRPYMGCAMDHGCIESWLYDEVAAWRAARESP